MLFEIVMCAIIGLSCEKGQAERDFVPVTVFDPQRNAAKDIELAVREANRSGRNILLNIGGDWCTWCRKFDKYFEQNNDIRDYLYQNYVLVKVNYSPDNRNKDVLSKYPGIYGYPHIFILNKSGKLIQSQDTAVFEEENSYNRQRILNFLEKFSPK